MSTVLQANSVSTDALLASSPVPPGQQAFIDAMQSQVGNFLGTQLDGVFSMISYPAGFHYGITFPPNGFYNLATLQEIDALLGVDSNGRIELEDSAPFSSRYSQILGAVEFKFSQQDTNTMNSEDTAASAEVASILTDFTDAGGTFSNPLPFGGKLQDVINQMTEQFGSLDNLPVSLNSLRNALASYQEAAGASSALHNQASAAKARLAAAIANVKTPSAGNGGMQVGETQFYAGFNPAELKTFAQLNDGLNTASHSVSVQIHLSDFNSESTNMSLQGQGGIEIPVDDFISISVRAQASFNLSRYTSASSTVDVTVNYPGVTLFASSPSVLSADASTGWYDNEILQEVVAKTGKDATGYQLAGQEFNVEDLFGPGKTFSRLKTFVISQQPTISMTFTSANASQLTTDFHLDLQVEVDLLDFPVGSGSAAYEVQNVDTDSQSGTVTLVLGPPTVSSPTPSEQLVAYVLGGVASYPPNNV